MKQPSLLKHLRDILILPFTVTVIVPYFIYNPDKLFPFHSTLFVITGALLVLAGVSLFLYTVLLFNNIGKGTLAPWSPTQKLVVAGPYRYCRNPMITGVFFVLLGETCILHSVNILIWAGAFFLINTVYFILKEEPDLYKRFGEDYTAYKAKVPRWIPRIKPYDQSGSRTPRP
jgi:protein-S-isoprenylcysteine O-methyltransferase Ste14